jgi:molybdopterin-guanine dinucleotide biosynthesis protein A
VTSATSAVVLAGGRSRRLGQDKRALRLASNLTLLETTISRVQSVADDVVVVGARDLITDARPRVRWIADAVPESGPLAGLVAGLDAIRHEFAVVVACDLPLLNPDLLHALADWPRSYDLLVPRRADGTLEMLHAVYRVTCRGVARRSLEERRLRLSELADAVASAGLIVEMIEERALQPIDPTLSSFFNVNTPVDLQLARRLIGETAGYESCENSVCRNEP